MFTFPRTSLTATVSPRVTFAVNVEYSSSMSFSKLKDAQKDGIFLSRSRGETYVIREIILTVRRCQYFAARRRDRKLSNRSLSNTKHGICHGIRQTSRQGTEYRKNWGKRGNGLPDDPTLFKHQAHLRRFTLTFIYLERSGSPDPCSSSDLSTHLHRPSHFLEPRYCQVHYSPLFDYSEIARLRSN